MNSGVLKCFANLLQTTVISSMSSVVPNLEEIQAAIASARSSPPLPTGMPSLLKKIKSEHPNWALGLPRLKKVVVELENKINIDKSSSTR
jgi:hypothetical protein